MPIVKSLLELFIDILSSITNLLIRDKKIEIVKTWYANKNNTILFALPSWISKDYGLDKPAHVIIEKTPNGLLLKKLKIEDDAKGEASEI